MHEIAMFVEDDAHHRFLDAIIKRLAREQSVEVKLDWRNVRRGYGAVINELKQYMRDLYRGRGGFPDLIVVATDANCKGLNARLKEINDVTQKFLKALVVCAIPDPHIERWMLIDSSAFKMVFGQGCNAPDLKCEKSRYKKMLIDSIRDAGIIPSFGGIEFAQDIAENMNLDHAARQDKSLNRFLHEMIKIMKEWRR
jgi:hypothetical protein